MKIYMLYIFIRIFALILISITCIFIGGSPQANESLRPPPQATPVNNEFVIFSFEPSQMDQNVQSECLTALEYGAAVPVLFSRGERAYIFVNNLYVYNFDINDRAFSCTKFFIRTRND